MFDDLHTHLGHTSAAAPLNAAPPTSLALPSRQVFDDYLRKRASKLGAKLINGLYMGLETKGDGPITIRYNEYKEGESG